MKTLVEVGRVEIMALPAVVFGIAYDGSDIFIMIACFVIAIDIEKQ